MTKGVFDNSLKIPKEYIIKRKITTYFLWSQGRRQGVIVLNCLKLSELQCCLNTYLTILNEKTRFIHVNFCNI